jgi:hypothetical protein
MRAAVLIAALSVARAGVVSRDWENGRLALQLDDGVAEVEWISGTSFRFARGFTSLAVLPKIAHDPVSVEFEDTRSTLTMRGRYMTVAIDKASAKLSVTASSEPIAAFSVAPSLEGLTMKIAPLGRTFGLEGPGDSRRFFFTSGYGMFVRAPRDCGFDLDHGVIHAHNSMDVTFYYGPTPKEIFEQHQRVTGKVEAAAGATPLPASALDSWEALAQLVRTLEQWSLSAVLYPEFDLSTLNGKGEVAKRAADLAAMLPLVSGDLSRIDAGVRAKWTPYLNTYLREAYDRGYPLIRPFPVEFSRDKNLDPQPGVFMLGDEVLLAPVIEAGTRRAVKLPRGAWTDLRTNTEYRGNQEIEIEAPPGEVPAFARNGAILPLAAKRAMELHYFPALGGEFFLWEQGLRENSQFHAAPAGEEMRVEIESKVARTYEWVIHHTNRPNSVGDYKSVRSRSSLKPGTWWHDGARNDLHVVVHAAAGVDTIVNISF